jgi:hypothetical protein
VALGGLDERFEELKNTKFNAVAKCFYALLGEILSKKRQKQDVARYTTYSVLPRPCTLGIVCDWNAVLDIQDIKYRACV